MALVPSCPMRSLEYKGYNKELQAKVFHRSITSMNIDLLRQGGSLVRAYRLKDLGMDREDFFIRILARIIHESSTRPWDSLHNVL
jgi:hypothetical protein